MGSLMPAKLGPGELRNTIKSEGYKAALNEFHGRLHRVATTVDRMAKAAVYEKALRTTQDRAYALHRALEATGDFGRLGPIERSMVTSIIPFYAFQKAMFRILLHMPVDHPGATGLFMQLGAMHEAYLKEKLGGTIPEAYLGASFIGGQLTPLEQLNPVSDAYRILSPEGIAQSMNPYAKLLAAEAMGYTGYGGDAGMDRYGNLVKKPDLGEQLREIYTGPIPGLNMLPGVGEQTGRPLGLEWLSPVHPLTQRRFEKLLRRIQKYESAKQSVEDGGYLVTDYNNPPAATQLGGYGGGVG